MEEIDDLYQDTARRYNAGIAHYDQALDLVYACLHKLGRDSTFLHYGYFSGSPRVEYYTFENGHELSRPVRPDLFITDVNEFQKLHDSYLVRFDQKSLADTQDVLAVNSLIYTQVMSFACCIDLWRRTSRKTPGTFFEVLTAALFQKYIPSSTLTKHVSLTGMIDNSETSDQTDSDSGLSGEKVSTDLVLTTPETSKSVIIPLKITTRERVVQPFVHQRILESAFPGKYSSLLACMSENQLDNKNYAVKQICVPGTIKLFQKYLAQLSGIYYCDIPQRYDRPDLQYFVNVKPFSLIFDDTKRLLFSS